MEIGQQQGVCGSRDQGLRFPSGSIAGNVSLATAHKTFQINFNPDNPDGKVYGLNCALLLQIPDRQPVVQAQGSAALTQFELAALLSGLILNLAFKDVTITKFEELDALWSNSSWRDLFVTELQGSPVSAGVEIPQVKHLDFLSPKDIQTHQGKLPSEATPNFRSAFELSQLSAPDSLEPLFLLTNGASSHLALHRLVGEPMEEKKLIGSGLVFTLDDPAKILSALLAREFNFHVALQVALAVVRGKNFQN